MYERCTHARIRNAMAIPEKADRFSFLFMVAFLCSYRYTAEHRVEHPRDITSHFNKPRNQRGKFHTSSICQSVILAVCFTFEKVAILSVYASVRLSLTPSSGNR